MDHGNRRSQLDHLLGLILYFHQKAQGIIKLGAPIAVIHDLPVISTMIRMKTVVTNDDLSKLEDIRKEIDEQLQKLEVEVR